MYLLKYLVNIKRYKEEVIILLRDGHYLFDDMFLNRAWHIGSPILVLVIIIIVVVIVYKDQ